MLLFRVAVLAALLSSHGLLGQFCQQGAKLVGSDAEGVIERGLSVAVSADGNTAAVGGPGDHGGAGAVWVYTRGGGTWTQEGSKLVGTGNVGTARLGSSVALSADGNTAIMGGSGDSTGSGAAWVFSRSGGVWTQQGTKLVGTEAVGFSVRQGYSVSLSADGNTAIVGGYGDNSNRGAAWIFTRSGSEWTQQGTKLVGTGAVGSAYQGWSVSLSADGNTAFVGGYLDNGGAGAAWVFTRSGNVWTQEGSKLVGTGVVGSANQGSSVSISADGNTAIVGGSGDNGGAGAAWVFTRSGVVWTQQGTNLIGSGAVGNAQQGSSVSLSPDGNTAVVGGKNDNGGAGAAWVFTRSEGNWTQQGTKLVGTGAVGAAVYQGASASLSSDGNTAFVGGPRDHGYAGAAWVFTRTEGNWTQQGAKLVGTDAVATSYQGQSVSLSADGNMALIGGYNDNLGTGAAWVFTRSGGGWTQDGAKLVGTGTTGGASQGWSVSLSADGNTAIVGGSSDSSSTGAAWVYSRSGGVWTQQGTKLVGTGSGPFSYQGYSVSLSADGNTAIVGGWGDSDSVGAAWVFARSGGVWTQQGNKLVGTGAVGAAHQGYSASLSADGNTAIVGGFYDSGSTGAAWVFTRSGGVWTQQGAKLVGNGAVGAANQGRSVSLSADGNTAIVGGYRDNGGAGAAWVFMRSGGIWTQQGTKLVGAGAVGSANQGSSVSVSADGNTAIVGGFYDNGYVGATWVFARSGDVWTQQNAKLVGTDAVGTPYQGGSVSLSANGSTAIAGGPYDNGRAGAAWVYATLTPGITQTAGTNPSCNGASITLDAGAGYLTYSWSPGGATTRTITVSPTSTSIYTVTVTNACASSSASHTQTVKPPVVGVAGANADICAGGAVTLAGSGGSACSWSPSTGLSDPSSCTPTASPTQTTTYSLTVTQDGCASSNMAQTTVTVSKPVFAGASGLGLVSFNDQCGLRLEWPAGASSCPSSQSLVYNVYRSTSSSFVPSSASLLERCLTTTFYNDMNADSGVTFYYVVRAENSGIGSAGPCNGGDEDDNLVRLSGTVPPETSCPTEPEDVTVLTARSGDGQNKLEWVNPSGSYSSTVLRYGTTGYPTSPTDGLPLATVAGTAGAHDSYVHTPITNDATYFYSVFVDGGGSYSSGQFVSGRPQATSGAVKWAYNTSASAVVPAGLRLAVGGVPGAVYTVSNDRALHATTLGPAGGHWPSGWMPLLMNAPSQSRPIPVNFPTFTVNGVSKVVYITSQDGRVYVADALTGALLRSTASPLGDAIQHSPGGMFRDFGGAYDVLIVGTRNTSSANVLYGLNPDTLETLWSFDNGAGANAIGIVSGAPLVHYPTARVYFTSRQRAGGTGSTVFCLSFTESSVTKVWEANVGSVDASITLVGGTLYIGNIQGDVYALNASDGTTKWTAPFRTNDGPVRSFVWGAGTAPRLYFSTTSKVWAVTDNGAGTAPTAHFTSPVAIQSPTNPLFTAGRLYVGSRSGDLSEIDPSTATPPAPNTVPLVDAARPAQVARPTADNTNQLIYAGTDAGSLYAAGFPF
jgi:hypothetical protein